MDYIKNCPKCERIQTYTTKGRLQKSILENWVCNLCSSVHTKKTYNDDIINNSVKLYEEGNSLSKIGKIVKIKRDNIKKILIDKNVWVEGRDKIKKEFTPSEIENILKKYEEGLSVEKISNLYGVSKTPIKRILKNEKLLRKGHSNGKKIELSEYQIKKIKDLYLNQFKNIVEIANELSLSKYFIEKHLSKCEYRRNRSEGTSVGLVIRYKGMKYSEYLKIVDELDKYKSEVMKITRQQPICELLNYDKRGLSGVEGAYHLDHKYSISEGFKNNISPEIIGNIKNLEFIPWEENVKKRTKCSITIKELIN